MSALGCQLAEVWGVVTIGFLRGWWKYSEIRSWWLLHNCLSIFKTNKFYTSNGWILCYVIYILIKLLKWKKLMCIYTCTSGIWKCLFSYSTLSSILDYKLFWFLFEMKNRILLYLHFFHYKSERSYFLYVYVLIHFCELS